jgi:hypothetical protein
MMSLIVCLFDRIIALRLISWVTIHYKQTAFQGKGTLHKIFKLRLLVPLCKTNMTSLFICFCDLSKVFDKVTRVLLLKKLIKFGIGACVLRSLKGCMYSLHVLFASLENSRNHLKLYRVSNKVLHPLLSYL